MQALADATVPPDRPDAWTHALMDVGRPPVPAARPRCADCPAIAWCRVRGGRAPAAGPRAPGRLAVPSPRFQSTNRWLRGRILDRARDADGWTGFDAAIGEHGHGAVRAAVVALARDGLLDVRETPAGLEARLPR